ncbi:hypothetical protein MMC08_005100 [Hypocenomyce scalaris]|nr:hypothetical protein [Hypocenomyce scalaris]
MAPATTSDNGETLAPDGVSAIDGARTTVKSAFLNGTGSNGRLREPNGMDLTTLENPSLQVTADHMIKLVPAPVLTPGRGDVLLQIKVTGICGSDIHFWKTGAIGDLKVCGDCVLGHEAAGIVVGCGEGVEELRIGDRVAMEPGVPCGECFLCREGRYNLCEAVEFAGVYPYAGSLQRIPDSMTYAQGALLEPLSVVMHGIEVGGLSLGQGVVICGAGPIGLIALAAARASGAFPLVITDLDSRRLAFAKQFVPACETYVIQRALGPQENAQAIRALFGAIEDESRAPKSVLECTGVESSIVTGAYTARRGGTVTVIGVGRPIVHNLPFMHMSLAEIHLLFINRYKNTWPAAISAIRGGVLNLDALVTHKFPLHRAVEAFELCSDISKGSIKVHVVDGEN